MSSTALVFGGAAPSTALNGIIDDLMFFQITLTVEQVKALFTGDLLKPGEMPAPTVTPAPASNTYMFWNPAPSSTADELLIIVQLTRVLSRAATA